MANPEKTIILMGLEAPVIYDNVNENRVVWRPKGTDARFQLMPRLNDWSTHVRAYALAKGLGEAGIKQALFLGCNSKQLAEKTATILEGYARVGGIEQIRSDEVDPRRSKVTILNMIIWGYGGRQ